MAIKSKGWTALPAVKIVSFALIIMLAFAFLSNVFFTAMLFGNNNIDLDIVFANVSGNGLFYRSYMNDALYDLKELLFFESEDNIKQGNCIRWVRQEDENGGFRLETSDGSRALAYYDVSTYETGSIAVSNGEFTISWNEAPYNFDGNEQQLAEEQIQLQREEMEKEAINNQLQSFRELRDRLKSQYGLIYFVSKDNFSYSNTDNTSIDSFMELPVFSIFEKGICIAQSHNLRFSPLGNGTIYIGYTADAITAQNARWQSMQTAIIKRIAATIGMAVLAFALFITLLCGAGRKRNSDTVYFNVLDKPYLDIGFGILFLYECAVGAMLSSIGGSIAYSYTYTGYDGSYMRAIDDSNIRGILILLAALVILTLPPALYYVMSFAKRGKAGKWWRHTLVWRVWNAVWSGCVGFAKSLWAGVPLTLKVGLICFCAYCAMLIVAAASGADGTAIILGFIASAAFAVPILRYARRLNKLGIGAKSASEGDYSVIDVHGGELGKIAGYVNNISAGIEAAVDERLKSERLKTELITNVSHDIRTPLTSLITYTDLLKSEGLASEKAPEYLDILIQKSQRLKTLTDELFEAAKASTGNIETHLETLDFAALMRQVLGELDERIGESGLDFRLNLPEHAWVLADGKLLWRVAENLLSNVFKYTLPKSRVYIDLVSEVGEVRLDIKNISAQPLNVDPSELTERFKRGDESRSSEGSGLGLSIVQSFIEAQNGRFKPTIDGDLFKASVYIPASATPTEGSVDLL